MRRWFVVIALASLVGASGSDVSPAWGEAPEISTGEIYSGALQADTELAIVVFAIDEGGEWTVQVESPAFTPWIRVFRAGGSGDEEFIGGALALSAYEPALMMLGAGEGTRYRIEVRSLYETWGGPFEVSVRPTDESASGRHPALDQRMQWVSEYAESSGDPILQARAEIASILPPAISEEASVADLMRQFPGNQLLGLWDPRWARLRWQFELVERFRENKQKSLDALETYRSVLDPNHPAIAATKLQLSEAIWKTGAVEEAGDLINQALAQLESAEDGEHPLQGQAVLSRGRWLRRVGALAESRPHLERAQLIFERSVGKQSLAASYSLEELGSLEWDRGDFSAAEAALEPALEIRQEILGPEDLRLLSVLKRLGVAQIAAFVSAPIENEPEPTLSKKEKKKAKKTQEKEQKKNMGPRSIPALESIQPTFVRIVQLTEYEIRSVPRLDRAWALSILASTAASPEWKKESASATRWVEDQLSLGGSYPPVKARADHVSTWEPLLYLDAHEAYARVAEKRPAPDPFRDLAQSLLRGGELRRSRELLEKVSSTAETDLGSDHLETILARAELANQLWRSEGNLPAVADTLEESREALKEKLGVDSVLVALVATD
ncbi:MAG: tetratricopeptide repeat protein, partial [Nitrospirae bacterium]|nr:tetratricopeptide repeat protein [Nitrospirota bacterium]